MENEIIVGAIEHFGKSSQISKAIEEMAELTTELARFQNDRGMNINIIEEIADVCIMIEQLKEIFGRGLVQFHIGSKLKRLRGLLEEHN